MKTTKEKIKKYKINKKTYSKKIEQIEEKYCLPFSYNLTTVKFVAQNPNTLFIYWEVSDKAISKIKKEYGDDFLEKTYTVLVVHNLTHDYSYTVPVNEFSNNWYLHVNSPTDTFQITLGRKEKTHLFDEPRIITIASSNILETPNDHVLSYDDNQIINIQNVITNEIISTNLGKNTDVLNNSFVSEESEYSVFNNSSSSNLN